MIEFSDEELLLSLAAGEVDALGPLYDRYGRPAYSVAFRVLGDRQSAEDVVQEAFLNVWRRAKTFDSTRGTARSWILSVIYHRTIDALRSRRGQANSSVTLEGVYEVSGPPDEIWQSVVRRFQREVIRGALAKIPGDQREAIELAYFQGMTHRQIAEQTSIPLGTVKSRIRNGIQKLRADLDDGENRVLR